ncbi:hypothetical protein FDP41_000330 [Naegleria fowleri]|uniref:Uncharacterized protein n=1 Tax=Naegleria fowleri TaxID=5763 RepID=A0A6A5CAZ4_NAEFO|nr:uncharacterized protein FDP41_000330 [Naegleria fowleri]KAF0984431.1 hypothetical protein FDP41_000330 [Naegleria fowleri]
MLEKPVNHLDSKACNGINVRRRPETQQVYYEQSPALMECDKTLQQLQNCLASTNSTMESVDASCKQILESTKSACGLRRLLYVPDIKPRVQNLTI